jgi:hypothetical protein
MKSRTTRITIIVSSVMILAITSPLWFMALTGTEQFGTIDRIDYFPGEGFNSKGKKYPNSMTVHYSFYYKGYRSSKQGIGIRGIPGCNSGKDNYHEGSRVKIKCSWLFPGINYIMCVDN